MKKLLTKITILILLFGAYSCSNDSYLFADKEGQMEIAKHQGALIGQWVLESEKSSGVVIGIQEKSAELNLQTPKGDTKIQSIKSLGDLGFVLEVNSGEKTDKIMARFKSYERTTLVVMNIDGFDLGIEAEVPMTFRKAKEETVLTASSNNF